MVPLVAVVWLLIPTKNHMDDPSRKNERLDAKTRSLCRRQIRENAVTRTHAQKSSRYSPCCLIACIMGSYG